LLFILYANLVFHFAGTGVVAYALHPGTVNTDIMNDAPGRIGSIFAGFRWAFKTPVQGAQTTLHCALDEELVEQKGLYYRYDSIVKSIFFLQAG
jgi:NAD(P)-dependent dehydrogenase (short-subunit alcohol dehydrogenase family)